MAVFLDSDGVIADMERRVFELSGKTPNDLGDDALWALVISVPDFWLNLDLMEGAIELVDFFRPWKPTILTGCPKLDYDRAATQKVEFYAKHFPDLNVITCLSKNKASHMQEGDILIDDTLHVVKRIEKAGRAAILHRNNADTIAKFNRMMGL